MNKITKALKAIASIAKNPWLLNKVLDQNEQWRVHITRHYGLKNGLPMVQPTSLFEDFDEIVFPYASLDGSSLPTDVALLRKFAREYVDCSYFEIGTWRGESAANVAAVAKECYTLNLTAEQMRMIGMGERYIELHRYFSSELENVTHLEGDSRQFDYASLGKKFDLIFIDGDHHFELVKNDTEKVFSHLIHDKSIVVWHDYAYNPEKIRFEVLAGILAGCPVDFHPHLYHIANTMCAVFVPQKLDVKPFSSPQHPEGAFEVKLRWKQSSNV